jgi:hypothetical protein
MMLRSHPLGPSTFQVIAPEHAVAVYEGILLQLWRTATTADGVKLVRRTLREFDKQIQLTIVILEDGAIRPDRDARLELDSLGKEIAPRPAMIVYEGDGFKAAAVRAVMTSIGLFTRQALRSRVFGSTESALEWTCKTYPRVAGVHTVRGFLAELRSPLHSERRLRVPQS